MPQRRLLARASVPRRSLLQILRELWRRIRHRRPPADPYADPYADRLVPLRHGPKGRSGAAVVEPDEGEDFYFPPHRQ